MSGACPECMRAFQRWFVSTAARFLSKRGQNTKAASLIDQSFRASDGKLFQEFNYRKYKEKVTAIFEDAYIKHAIIGIDFHVNEHNQKDFQPHWQPHLWAISPKVALDRGAGILRYHLEKGTSELAPVV